MEKELPRLPEASLGPITWREWLIWGALLGWQFWLALSLFGESPWETLHNDQPILSGAHPQHLYLASVGSAALRQLGQTSVYDPNFQAGYLKTPIFDGARAAELFLFLMGGGYQPNTYKWGVVCECLAVPILLLIAGRAAGLGAWTTCIATFLGQLLWWGPIGRQALEAGDSELLLASLAGLAHVGLLLAFHRTEGWLAWFGLLITGSLGWFWQPMLFPIAMPLLLVFYLSVGAKHEKLQWHVGFWGVEVLSVLVNLTWLMDWVNYWWLRAALPNPAAAMLTHRNFASVWRSPLWGSPTERALATLLLVSAIGGLCILHQTSQRPAARLFGLGFIGAMLLAVLGVTWEPLGMVGTSGLLAPALWFAAFPAVHGWTFAFQRWSKHGWPGAVVLCILLTCGMWLFAGIGGDPIYLAARCWKSTPLIVGLSEDRADIVAKLREYTSADMRILWQDRDHDRLTSHWPALLPVWTDRAYLGALDPEGVMEHSSIAFLGEALEGQPVSLVKADQLDDYCTRYNVGWVVAWTESAKEHFSQHWPNAEPIARFRDGPDEGVLFRIRRDAPDFTLRGKARVLEADSHRLVLGDVEPDAERTVVLSFHFQQGMKASPSRVVVTRSPSGDDPIGFVRLNLADKATRVTLTWQP